MVTRARIVAQYIMTNSVTAVADDMKVLKKWKTYNHDQKLQTPAENHNVQVNHTYLSRKTSS